MSAKILDRLPLPVLYALDFLDLLRQREWLAVASRIFRTEWTEAKANGHKTWPHCCTQAGCWMHLGPPRFRCSCGCVWCRIARRAEGE